MGRFMERERESDTRVWACEIEKKPGKSPLDLPGTNPCWPAPYGAIKSPVARFRHRFGRIVWAKMNQATKRFPTDLRLSRSLCVSGQVKLVGGFFLNIGGNNSHRRWLIMTTTVAWLPSRNLNSL